MDASVRPATTATTRAGHRAVWRRLHRWLGLTFGLPLAVLGLTGSVLVFWQEIDAALNPALFDVAPARKPAPLQVSIDAAVRAAPAGWEGLWVPLPDAADAAVPFSFYYPEPRASQVGAESLTVFVDPGSARVIGQRIFYHPWNPLRHSFVGFFFKLHYAFFLGAIGMIVVGVIGVLLLAGTATGTVIWWPRGGRWRRALSIKRNAAPARFNHDLHQTTAVYSLVVWVAVLISGLSFNLPDQFTWVVRQFSPLTAPAAADTAADTAASPRAFDLDAVLADLERRHPGGRRESVTASPGAQGSLTVCYADVPELSRHVQDTRCFVLAAQDGALLQVQDASRGTAGDVFMSWQWPLHSGTILGWTGRILVFLAGLACVVLPVTGLIRWLQKRRAELRIRARARG